MLPKARLVILLTAVLSCGLLSSRAQSGLCPSNLDFELGDFSNWILRTGTMDRFGNVNWDASPGPGRHAIIAAASGLTDPFGLFPQAAPNGSLYSLKLGTQSPGAQIESISYIYSIPPTVTNFSMLFYYAVVLESPGHSAIEQPRFQARIVDVSTGQALPCVNFDFIAGSSTGGFRTSSSTGNNGSAVLYKDWTPISINLSAYIGRTIQLEFITRDCTLGGHSGYAYVDVASVCNGAIQGSTVCQGDDSTTLTAPYGFQGYTWYADATFSQIISTNQTVTFTPPPAVGTVYPVIVDPYPGFGCRDTLYATITVSPKPVSDAGPDKVVCIGQTTQIGAAPVPAYQYSWTPTALVNNPLISNPIAGPVPAPTEFYVKTTDLLTGCISYDTTVVSNYILDTVVQVTGVTEFCEGAPLPTLAVNGSSTNIQWYEATGGPIPGATGLTYQPASTGSYWAEISQAGCPDSTNAVPVTVHPLPLPSFTYSDTGCIKSSQITFTNTSVAPDAATMNYIWTFNDGDMQTTTDAVRNFTSTGNFTVTLEAITQFGCRDISPSQPIHILPNGTPRFTWDSICVSRPMQFFNLSNENSSPQVTYLWDFNDGNPPVMAKNPPPVTYSGLPRQIPVTLKMTTLGCESDTQTLVRIVQVNRAATGIVYPGFTVAEGATHYLHARDSIGNIFDWRPHIQLTVYDKRYTEFIAVNDVTYNVYITDPHTCVTIDTITILVLKKRGFYLPTAFTPNGDGLNDIVRPYLVGMKGLKSFTIFNRWGNQIFRTTKYGEGWDGTINGEKQAPGVYVWLLEFYNENNVLVQEKGNLTLIR